MIILDTNVLSELVKRSDQINPGVWDWAVSQPLGSFATTAPSLAENLAGFRVNAESREMTRKQRLFEQIIARLCDGRVYPFDARAAREYAELVRECRTAGRPVSKIDGQIAAIARIHGLPIATRDADFRHLGVPLVNPWEHRA